MPRKIISIYKFLYVSSGIILIVFSLELFIRLKPKLYCVGYRPSASDKLVYELQPNYRLNLSKTKISRQGLNERYYRMSKPNDVYRIAVVGDSTSFGWKLSYEESFPKQLELELNKNIREKRFEVINFSVPGYNTAQELEILKVKTMKFNPDMVILVYCGNDTHICNLIKPKVTMLNFLYNKSFLVHTILRNIDILINTKSDNNYLNKYWALFKNKILGMFYYNEIIHPYPGLENTPCNSDPPGNMEKVPQRYRYMVGFENYKIHLSEINNLLRKNEIKFASAGFFTAEALKINRELGIKYICDFNEVVYNNRDILIPEDGHLNIKGHHLIAIFIYNFLKASGLVF